jgi:hypothetical protein
MQMSDGPDIPKPWDALAALRYDTRIQSYVSCNPVLENKNFLILLPVPII